MAVKGSSTAARVLTVLEAIAAHQPIGVAALARMMSEDKSAVQRAIVTLADQGWIKASDEPVVRWILTPRILAVAHSSQNKDDFQHRAQLVLDQLAAQSGETAIYTSLEGRNLVLTLTAESGQALRMVPHTGALVPINISATGRAVLSWLSPERMTDLLGEVPDAELRVQLQHYRTEGYALSAEVNTRAMTLASAVFEVDGRPIGGVGITGPVERMTPDALPRLGRLVSQAARLLSRGEPRDKAVDLGL